MTYKGWYAIKPKQTNKKVDDCTWFYKRGMAQIEYVSVVKGEIS